MKNTVFTWNLNEFISVNQNWISNNRYIEKLLQLGEEVLFMLFLYFFRSELCQVTYDLEPEGNQWKSYFFSQIILKYW